MPAALYARRILITMDGMRITPRILFACLLPFYGLVPFHAVAAGGAAPPDPSVENKDIFMQLRPRTAEQMAAFYEARGFPELAIGHIKQACFVTAIIKNKSNRVIWLDLNDWHFETPGGELRRHDRDDWDALWQKIDLPQAYRSTFGWTQLPVVRDLQPGEGVGGNITLPRGAEAFTLQADFFTGKTRRLGMISLRFENIHCPEDAPDQ